MRRNDNHGLSSCIGSVNCAGCGGVCSEDESLSRDTEPRESMADYRTKMVKALEKRRREGYPGLPPKEGR